METSWMRKKDYFVALQMIQALGDAHDLYKGRSSNPVPLQKRLQFRSILNMVGWFDRKAILRENTWNATSRLSDDVEGMPITLVEIILSLSLSLFFFSLLLLSSSSLFFFSLLLSHFFCF